MNYQLTVFILQSNDSLTLDSAIYLYFFLITDLIEYNQFDGAAKKMLVYRFTLKKRETRHLLKKNNYCITRVFKYLIQNIFQVTNCA